MTGPDRLLAGAKSLIEQVGALECYIEQASLSRCLIVGDGGFIQMAQIIEFVAVDFLHFPTLRAGPAMRMFRINRARGVEVAIGFLRRSDFRNQSINIGFEFRIWLNVQRISSALDHFINVSVIEGIPWRRFVRNLFTSQRRGSTLKVINALCLFVLFEGERNRNLPIDFQTWRPESVVEMDGSERNRLDGIVARSGCSGRGLSRCSWLRLFLLFLRVGNQAPAKDDEQASGEPIVP